MHQLIFTVFMLSIVALNIFSEFKMNAIIVLSSIFLSIIGIVLIVQRLRDAGFTPLLFLAFLISQPIVYASMSYKSPRLIVLYSMSAIFLIIIGLFPSKYENNKYRFIENAKPLSKAKLIGIIVLFVICILILLASSVTVRYH